MEAKRRQQQLCAQALHHQSMSNQCTHGTPLGYLPSPWVMWDAGRLAEANRRRKQKKRLCTACLLAGVAIAVLGVAGVAGLAVYLGGTPPTEGAAKWESFRRAGEESPHRLQNRHGILLRAETPEKTTPPARSPWAIRREEGVRWEGRGSTPSPSPSIPREDHMEFAYEESEGIPEVEVVLEGREGEVSSDSSPDGDKHGDRTKSQSARSPYARASEGQRPAIMHLPETSGSPVPPSSASQTFMTGGVSKEWDVTAVNGSSEENLQAKQGKEEGNGTGVRRRNHRQWEGEQGSEIVEGEREEDEEMSEEEGRGNHREWEEDGEEGGEEESDESEEDLSEEEDASDEMLEEDKDGREERRQHQASNKVATEGIPVFNMLTKILKRLNSSTNPKEVEIPSLNNGTTECNPTQFRCSTPNEGIMCLPASSRCDGVRDCVLNGEDEVGCNCADTLRSRFLHRKICDGVPDCWDYSDEDQCAWCTPGQLVCGGGARICVEPKRICDGVKDCPGGDDESHCIALYSGEEDKEVKMVGPEARRVNQRGRGRHGSARGSDHITASMITNEVLPYRSSGYLLVRKKGVWGKLCLDQSKEKEATLKENSSISAWNAAEIGFKVCKAMTHRAFEVVEQVTEDDENKEINSTKSFPPYYQLENVSNDADILESMQNLHTTDCSSKKVVRVKCKDLECGVRPKVRLNQWSRTQRIVGGGNAAPGAWPWQAALYREGEFQCGATLISDHWLVSAGHCFFHAREDYWVARLGTLRRGTDLPSPHEQRRPVSSIILHPGYVDAGFLNDIALLRLSSPVEITDHVRPACLPPRPLHLKPASIPEKDLEYTTSDEGISYDENVTTYPPVLTTYEVLTTDMITDTPYTVNDLNDLNGNSPTKDILWESTFNEEDEFGELLNNNNNTTSTKQYVLYKEKPGTEKEPFQKTPDEYVESTFPNTEIFEHNPEVYETSTYQSTNYRFRSTAAVTSNINIIQTAEEKVKYEKDNVQQANGIRKNNTTEAESIYNHHNSANQDEYLTSTRKYLPADVENHPPNNTQDITNEKQSIEFSVSKAVESRPLNSTILTNQASVKEETTEYLVTTSANTPKVEIMNEFIDHKKLPIKILPDVKFVDTINDSATLSLIPETLQETNKYDHNNSNSADDLFLTTEPINHEATATESSTEQSEAVLKDRKTRDVNSDDAADDGIRNGRLCTVVGWGQLFEVGRIFPDTLQEVELPLISTSECRKRTLFLPLYHLTDAMFCAGYDRGGRDACLGDSGGPLMCQEPDGHWSLYGVTSNGYGCARANRPGVYTKVSHYIPWMEEVMAKEDAAQEESQREEERRGKEAMGEGEEWSQWWEWRRRRGDEQGTLAKHFCPHRCPLGECLQRARICNGVVDCSDASDEESCQGELNLGR